MKDISKVNVRTIGINLKFSIEWRRFMKGVVIRGFEPTEKFFEYKLHLLPQPQVIGKINGFLKTDKELELVFHNVDSKDVVIEIITEELSQLGKFKIKALEEAPRINLDLYDFPANTIQSETYLLTFEENNPIIVAKSEKGIYYGVNTFLQLLRSTKDGILFLPKIEITDYPAYIIRAITDQTSRNQIPTVENMKKTIKFLSKFKMNYHFLYLEDGFNFKKYPDIGKARGGYTAEEIKEIQAYAKRYFMEIVPIFNSFGHVDNILMTNYPKYAHLGEFPGAACYDVSNPKVRAFLEDLLKELCETFNSKFFHLGLDETFDFGKYNTKQLVKEKGKGAVMLEFYNFLIETLKKFGKRNIICYHDNVLGEKTLLTNLPKDLIVFYWDYWVKTWLFFPKRKYKKAKKLRENGYQVILSPTLYDFTRNFPDIKRTIQNVVSMAKYGLEIGALGIATSVWGDFLNENLRENNYFGYLVTAEASWAPQLWNEEKFKENFIYQLYSVETIDLIKALEYLNVYNELHPIYPVKFFSHIWRHPFPSPKKIKAKVKNLDRILDESEEALQLIAKIKPNVKKNKENLDYLAYAARLGIYLAKKYKIPQEIQKKLNQKDKEEVDITELIEQITYLKNYLKGLKKDYEELWLKAAKPQGLKPLLERFDAHILFYEQKIQEINKGIIWTDPFLKAEFITAPQKVKIGDPIYLRKSFQINKPVKSCHIQGMCDMVMQLYLNGEKLTEIVSKMSLSVEPILQRIQLLDVTEQIKPGTNVIAAECHNYLIQRVAGNIYLEIEYEDGEHEVILSNSTWKASHQGEPNWFDVEYDDTHWFPAKSLGAPPKISGYITTPLIHAGIKSQDNYYYAMDTFLKGLLPWAPSFLINLGKKLVGLDIF